MLTLSELNHYTCSLLATDQFKDYAPNGLQISGKTQIAKIVTGVTLNKALIDAAIQLKADSILVHHGMFWKGENPCLVGSKFQRIQALIQHNISLFAFHLPLDAHPQLGNNVQLGLQLGLHPQRYFGDQQLGCLTETTAISLRALQEQLKAITGREVLLIGDAQQTVSRIAWCTGGADSYFQPAIDAGAEVFITGEVREPIVHIARESGVACLAAGHHATERGGIMALGQHLAEQFQLEHAFVDINSPL